MTNPTDRYPARRNAAFVAIRKRLGVSQSEVARLIGSTTGYVSQIELGHRGMSLDQCCRIADAMGVDASEFDPRLARTITKSKRKSE